MLLSSAVSLHGETNHISVRKDCLMFQVKSRNARFFLSDQQFPLSAFCFHFKCSFNFADCLGTGIIQLFSRDSRRTFFLSNGKGVASIGKLGSWSLQAAGRKLDSLPLDSDFLRAEHPYTASVQLPSIVARSLKIPILLLRSCRCKRGFFSVVLITCQL